MPISPSLRGSAQQVPHYAPEQPAAPPPKPSSALEFSGLDLGSVGNAIVRIKAPLKGGLFSLVAPFARARVQIRKSTVAQISFGVRQKDGKPAIGSANITFTPAIKIKNPASALKPTPGRVARLLDVDALKDKVADVILCGIHLSKDGQIHVDGYLKVGPFSKKKLSDVMTPSDFKNDSGKKLDLEALLKDIGVALDDATFSIEAHSNEERQIALAALGVQAWTEKAAAHTKVNGDVRLTRNNSVHLNINQEKSYLRFGESTAHVGGEVRVTGLTQKPTIQSHIAYKIRPNNVQASITPAAGTGIDVELIDGETQISGHAFVFRDSSGHVTLKDASNISVTLGAKAIGDLKVASEKFYGQLHNARAFAHVKANFSREEDGFHVTAGEASALISARDFKAIYQGIDLSAPGEYTVNARVPMWQYTSNNKSPSANGSLELGILPRALHPFRSYLRFDIRDDATVQIDHVRKGVTEFLKPFGDLVPKQTHGQFTPGVGCSPIGSAEFRVRCEDIGDAPIRSNNSVELLVDGITSLPKRLELINGAQKSICLQTLIFKDDQTGLQITDALCAAVARGVDVKVIIDALGNATTIPEVLMMNPIYRRLKKGGVQLELYNNSLGEGLQDVFASTSNSSKISDFFTLEDLGDPKKIFSAIPLFAKAALGDFDFGLTQDETTQLGVGLTRILGGAKSELSLDLVRQLASATEDNILEFSEVLKFIGNNAHLNLRWHEKYLIADQNAAIVGGINTADEYLLGGTGAKVLVGEVTSEAFRDTDVLVKGNAARDAWKHFADNWKDLTSKVLAADETPRTEQFGERHVQMVHSRPKNETRSPILDLHIECLGSLNHGDKAYMENAFFVTSGRAKQLEDALIQAAQRGVDVRVLMNSETSIDVKDAAYAGVFSKRALLESGVRVFERLGERMMHSKVAVFGTKVATVGSWNADNRSSSLNAESSAFIHDDVFAAQVEQMIADDMKNGVSREIHFSEIAYLPFKTEARNTAKAMLSDLL
jgi:phosphatidylserine/phosphatidylglycerophosphate/cardiolipin synthase-like enzyme